MMAERTKKNILSVIKRLEQDVTILETLSDCVQDVSNGSLQKKFLLT